MNKKLIGAAAAMVMCAALISSCGGAETADETEKISGKYNAVIAKAYGVTILTEEINMEMWLDFDDDGNVSYSNNGEEGQYKWTQDKNTVNIGDKHTATVDGDTLTMELSTVNGDEIKVIMAKEGTDAEDPTLYITEDDITLSMIKSGEISTEELRERLGSEAIDALGLDKVSDQ